MTHDNIAFSWHDHGFHDRYQTGVSLHSHTMYSRENLGFIPRIASRFPIFAGALNRGRDRFRRTPPLNGLRPWAENRRVLDVASRWSLTVISGGGRHAHEPNAILNLTDAPTFEELAAEVRDGHSQILFMRQYQEPFRLRILHNLCDVLSDQHGHTRGWRLWSDRIFFQLEDGTVKPLTEWFGEGPPVVVDQFVRFSQCVRSGPVRSLLRIACGRREQAVT